MEHGTRVELVYAVLQTAAWAAWLTVRDWFRDVDSNHD